MNRYIKLIKFLEILNSEDRYFTTSEIRKTMLEQYQVKVEGQTIKSMAESFNEAQDKQKIAIVPGNPIKYKLETVEDKQKIPQLLFDKWHWVETDGLPEEEYIWCILMWKCHDGTLDMHVGSYFEEKKEFYVNFGLGGAVLDADSVIGWADFADCEWHAPELAKRLLDEFQQKHPFHMHIALDEERMAQDGLDPEEKWIELRTILADIEGICMAHEGFVVSETSGARSWFYEILEETPWFMRYVTRWEIDDPTVKDDVIETLREMGVKVGE